MDIIRITIGTFMGTGIFKDHLYIIMQDITNRHNLDNNQYTNNLKAKYPQQLPNH